jgi:hypothetical protein
MSAASGSAVSRTMQCLLMIHSDEKGIQAALKDDLAKMMGANSLRALAARKI